MNALIKDVSVLLQQFQQSPWRDFYVRIGTNAIFMAKADGAANPLLTTRHDAAASNVAPRVLPSHAIVAPHVATLLSLVSLGTQVQVGSVIGELDVLGAVEQMISQYAEIVESVLAPIGGLVEFETPLLFIRAS